MPRMVPVRKRASVAWRLSYGTVSPIQAIDSGTMPAPDRARQNTSTSSDSATNAPALPSAQANVATLTTRYLP